MALLSERSMDDWVAEYAKAHQHPSNRLLHTLGIPLIALSIILLPGIFFMPKLGWLALALFVVGWIFQFVGHAYEGKPPEFLKDWRFLFVGLRWWIAKVAGRV